MVRGGTSRERLAQVLNAAYADGLLSEKTFMYRIDQLFGSVLVDPAGLVGDLTQRGRRRRWHLAILRTFSETVAKLEAAVTGSSVEEPMLLALDWSGGQEEVLLGRHPQCHVVMEDPAVSRWHARLVFRDGNWILQDLGSTNGTTVNGARVIRCEIRPGDRVSLAGALLAID